MRKTIDRELVLSKLRDALSYPESLWSKVDDDNGYSEYPFKFGVLSRSIEIIIEDIVKGEGGF